MSELRHGNDILNPVVMINPVDDENVTPENTWSAQKISDLFGKRIQGTAIPLALSDELIDTSGTPSEFATKLKEYTSLNTAIYYRMTNRSINEVYYNYGLIPTNTNYYLELHITASPSNFFIRATRQSDGAVYVRSVCDGNAKDWLELATADSLVDKADKTMLSNPNLLDNPWFTVNQRRFTSKTLSGSAEYFVDRWSSSRSVITLNSDNSVDFSWNGTSGTNAWIEQWLEKELLVVGKTYTLSAIIDNQLFSATGVLTSGGGIRVDKLWDNDSTNRLSVGYNSTKDAWEIAVWTTSITPHNIQKIKLELGSVSTLANDAPPNYATELMKCKRYYQRIIGSAMYFSFVAGTNSSAVYFPFLLETEMRANPTIKCSVMPYIGEVSSGSTQATNQVTELTCSTKDFRLLEMKATTTSTVPNGVAKIYLKDSNTIIEFSADL